MLPNVVVTHVTGFVSKFPVMVMVEAAGKFLPILVVVRVIVQDGAVPPRAIADTSAVGFAKVGADLPKAASAAVWSAGAGHALLFSL